MDECIRVLNNRIYFSVIILFMGLSMLFCKPNHEVSLSNIPTQNLCKVEFLNRYDVLFSSEDKDKISDFLKGILTANVDNSGVNYKSFEFIKFYDTTGKTYRIAILENRFLAGGEKYITEIDIKQQFQKLFNTTLLY